MKVPFAALKAQHAAIRDEVVRAALEVVEAQAFILGEPVARFEKALAAAWPAEHAIGVASGTDALVLALRALGIGPGDAVITSAYSFIAPAEAIAQVGATPIFVDVEEESFNLSVKGVEAAIARGGRLRAILPVHLFGRAAAMDALVPLARAHGLAVVEDAAQSIGASPVLGDVACTSFFPSKNLGGWGDGGAVLTNDGEMAARVRSLRAHGVQGSYRHVDIGTNSRLDALQAAVLSVKLGHLPEWTGARRRVAARYRAGLAGRVALPADVPGHVYNQFVVRTKERDALARALAEAGVETKVYYPIALPDQPCFAKEHAAGDFPVARALTKTALALPMYPELTDAQIDHVTDVIRRFSGAPH